MTKLKETIHFENEEGICKICVELGRQSAQKEFEKLIDELLRQTGYNKKGIAKEFDFIYSKHDLKGLKSKLKSATTKMNSNTSSNDDEITRRREEKTK